MRVLVLFLALAALAHPAGDAEPIVVSAAVSLTEGLEEVARAYTRAGGAAVRFNFGGSNTLARQIAAGAPVDLFISADAAQMHTAVAAGAIDAATITPLLGNRLAIVVRRGGPAIRHARDLLSPSIRRIALGEPSAVPAGVYARQFLEAEGLWRSLEPKVVPLGNVRAALAAAATGSVDAAFVYVTDASMSEDVSVALVIQGPSAPRIIYPAALTTRAHHRRAAKRFLDYLRGPEAAAVFSRHGFIVKPGGA